MDTFKILFILKSTEETIKEQIVPAGFPVPNLWDVVAFGVRNEPENENRIEEDEFFVEGRFFAYIADPEHEGKLNRLIISLVVSRATDDEETAPD